MVYSSKICLQFPLIATLIWSAVRANTYKLNKLETAKKSSYNQGYSTLKEYQMKNTIFVTHPFI